MNLLFGHFIQEMCRLNMVSRETLVDSFALLYKITKINSEHLNLVTIIK